MLIITVIQQSKTDAAVHNNDRERNNSQQEILHCLLPYLLPLVRVRKSFLIIQCILGEMLVVIMSLIRRNGAQLRAVEFQQCQQR